MFHNILMTLFVNTVHFWSGKGFTWKHDSLCWIACFYLVLNNYWRLFGSLRICEVILSPECYDIALMNCRRLVKFGLWAPTYHDSLDPLQMHQHCFGHFNTRMNELKNILSHLCCLCPQWWTVFCSCVSIPLALSLILALKNNNNIWPVP